MNCGSAMCGLINRRGRLILGGGKPQPVVLQLDAGWNATALPVVDTTRAPQGSPTKTIGYSSAPTQAVDQFSSGDVHMQH